jgi:HKD family nuclease
MNLIIQPGCLSRLGDFLCSHLHDERWRHFRAGVAFMKYSGVRHLAPALSQFVTRGGRARISVGVDFGGTTAEGLKGLLDCVGSNNEVWVYHNEGSSTFHPKLYLFKAEDGHADLAVGSGNLTEGGMFTNYEAAVMLALDPDAEGDAQILAQAEEAIASWCDASSGMARRLDLALIEKLLEQGYILTERQAARVHATRLAASKALGSKTAKRKPLFASTSVAKPPAPKWHTSTAFPEPKASVSGIEIPPAATVTGFLMTLQKTDVGVGQTTTGTSRRSPEVFIPLAARDYAPAFWGWPTDFSPDPTKPGKMDRSGVKMWLGTQVIDVNMMTWPDKHDFRLRSEALRSGGSIGDILRLEKADSSIGFDYLAYVVPQGTMEYRHYMTFCINKAKGKSQKLWGYY